MINKLVGLVVGREPVMLASVVSAGIGLAVAYGAHISDEQQAGITAVVVAVLGFGARMAVTPVRRQQGGQ